MLGTPTHTNIGDSAIVLAQNAFLRKNGFNSAQIIELTLSQMQQDWKHIHRWIPKTDIITHLGGGNMGSQWKQEEALHRQVTCGFPRNPMIVFPQTIFYADENSAQESVDVYNRHHHLTIVAREQKSHEIMARLYPDIKLLLSPDIVLSATMDTFGVHHSERQGVLLCMRQDAERAMSDDDRSKIESFIKSHPLTYRCTDMHSDYPITKENRLDCVRQKMAEFSSAKLVITDRLHGMIFAAITGTPCIAFSNYNHKVRGTYDWISYLPYIRYAQSTEDAIRMIPELLDMENCVYDSTPLQPYFEELAQVVKNYAHN